MKLFRYLLLGAALLVSVTTVQAQNGMPGYNTENGVSTSKKVSEKQSDGTYIITLETFATGEQTLVESSTPVDVVLVLDISGSMVQPKGSTTNVPDGTNISYNTVKNSDICYFFRDGDGDYDQIYCEEYDGRYYLYYDYGAGKTYIYNRNGSVRTSSSRPTSYAPTNANSTIFTTEVDYNYYSGTYIANTVTGSIARIDALKEAVNAFIAEIDHNDAYDSKGNPRPDKDGDGNPDRIGNRISIVTFSANANTRHGLTPVEGNVTTLQNTVNSFVPAGGTNAAGGMSNANTVLNSASATSNQVVIMFTDGQPNNNTETTVITNAKTIKDRGALIYTVGVFTDTPSTNGQIWRYMNYVSSNYPNATGINQAGSGGDPDAGFYHDASTSSADLTDIFVSIAQGIGSADATVDSTTQIRDYVTSSFTVPSGTASEATFYTLDIKSDGSGWENKQIPAGVSLNIGKKTYPDELDDEGNPVQRDTVGVTGFDFSSDDNWVGPRYPQGQTTPVYKGKKLVIEFKVRADANATGGDGSATNTSDSGVYVLKDGVYTNVNSYDVPHANLPLRLVIKKDGLRGGESATFEIERCKPLMEMPEGGSTPADSVVVYNALGKPQPNGKWENWSKVILTNKTEVNGKTVVKTLVGLDPGYVYRITEDNWGWSYTMTGAGGTLTTSQVEVNPFHFNNVENENAPKHAEAVMINHFANDEGESSRTEHAKSTKTKFD